GSGREAGRPGRARAPADRVRTRASSDQSGQLLPGRHPMAADVFEIVQQDEARVRWSVAVLEAQHGHVDVALLEALPEFADRQAEGDAHHDPIEAAVGDGKDRSLIVLAVAVTADVLVEK